MSNVGESSNDNNYKVHDECFSKEETPANIDKKGQNRYNDDECFNFKRIIELTSEDIWGLEFSTEKEACEFYSKYARCHGFSMRKDDVGRNVQGDITRRQLVCNKEGWRHKKHLTRLDRKKEHKPVTRTNCPARIRFNFDYKSKKWKVTVFEESHNHVLTPPRFVHLVPAYRVMSDADKAQVNSLKSYGVRTCHIMGYMMAQKGGYAEVGFTKKDLYNHIDRGRRKKVKDGDAFAALIYLQSKADNDPLLLGKYTLTDDGNLQDLFWADGASIIDYECFGDVIAFDTTYKKNKYNKPLVIFSGSNHHGQTTIFGCALVSDEKVETYKWVLQTFLEIMSNKHPTAVVTDGDGAMREAIKEVFPKASHRLCAWHLHRNACENVKNPQFLEDFKRLIYSNFTPEEFEEKWNEVSLKHGLSSNKWVTKTYENKTMWATAYLRDKFFGHIRTTSQCEGINSLIKNYVRKKSSLVDFMHTFHEALREYRNNELISDFNCMFSTPVLTTCLHEYERHAAKVFTREIFKEVKCEIEDAGAVNVTERLESEDNVLFKMNRFGIPKSQYQVMYDKRKDKFLCDCRLFESRGIPCRHILCAMKHDHFDCIPNSLICKRWTKDAKSDYICSIRAEESDAGKMETLRFGSLASLSNRLCNIASKNVDDFKEIRDEIYKLLVKLETKHDLQRKPPTMSHLVGDPAIVKTKGAPSKRKYGWKRRRCSNCNKHGHTIRRCPLLLSGDNSVKMNIESSCSESENDITDDEKANDGGCKNDNEVLQSRPTNPSTRNDSASSQAIKNVRRCIAAKPLQKKAISPHQNCIKGDVNKTQESNPTQTGVQVTPANANMASIVPPQTSNEGFVGNNQHVAAFPHYPGMPVYPPYTPYPMYGGVPLYPHFPPHYFGSNYGSTKHGPNIDDVSKKKKG